MEKIKLRQAIIVEGKYDKIKLESIADTLILTLDGFGVYRDTELKLFLRTLARERGLIVLTDSDSAGFRLRGYISGMVSADDIVHLYIPDIFGKEPRKARPSAEGKLGVEGIPSDTLRNILSNYAISNTSKSTQKSEITVQDFYDDGLTGTPDSSLRRRKLFTYLGLPAGLSVSAAVKTIGSLFSREQYESGLAWLDEN